MKCIVLPNYNANIIRAMKSLVVDEKTIPVPGEDQVLIKVSASPCNPSDIAFMRGMYNIKKPIPVVMGFEGAGQVVSTGVSKEAQNLIGKRVSCFTQSEEDGTWAEYFVTDWQNCIELIDEISDDQAAALCVNPFTAYALFEIALKLNASSIIQNASSGQIGVFIRTMARNKGISVINIVRKDEHEIKLKGEGERFVLNMLDASFEEQLREISGELGPTLAIDAVGGSITGQMFNALAYGGKLIMYGGLSGKLIDGIDPMNVIFKDKQILGFNLGDWKEEIGLERFREVGIELQRMISNQFIETTIQGNFSLDQVGEALAQYIRNMSSGKILFKP